MKLKKKEENSYEIKYSEVMISKETMRLFNLLFCVIGFVFIFINIKSKDVFMVWVNGGLSVCCLLSLILNYRNHPKIALMINFTSITTIVISYMFNGGANGFSILWMLLLPSIFLLALPLREGLGISIALWLVLIAFFWTPLKRYCYPYSDTFFLRFPIVLLSAILISFLTKTSIRKVQEKRDELLEENIYYRNHLQEMVNEQAEEIKQKAGELSKFQHGIILGIANIVESRDGGTGAHIRRTSEFVDMLANALLERKMYPEILNEEYVSVLSQVAPMHDIGKIHIPDAILKKPDKLTEEEMDIMKEHAREGGQLILKTMQDMTDPDVVQMAYDVATYHHERWDGTGYPEGLAGNEIPLSARIMALADVFEALTVEREYKPAFSIDSVFEMMKKESGTHFDPEITKVFLELKPQLSARLKQLNKERE
ncbi:MAG: HD-GYP domain-containing protein [Lachnospiraceae bacterium]